MRNKIFRALSFLIAFIALIPLILFGGAINTEVLAQDLSPEANGDNPLGIVVVPSDNNPNSGTAIKEFQTGGVDVEEYPDLGDDQVFPFVAGLGSNS